MPNIHKPSPKTPNPIDVKVGARLRALRNSLRCSQEKLGEALGITFQQIQKYEKGSNRIGASRLQNIAEIFNVPVSYFFDTNGQPENPLVTQFLSNSEFVQLAELVAKIKNPRRRRVLISVARELAATDRASREGEAEPR
ncbi:transcriptional regulator [Brucella endophytica]|uniref:Transcriptional regulator n=1 Tax=Brucella endophytica TaxID=1963359 RepID=A0A916WLC6_9HYPH|nr:helix-turn-helix transcriptional regulator [Brucella endophytica]GGB08972.1 transcriptional regulator [Brucella endophytica]